MPEINSFNPSWLSSGQPGHEIFLPSTKDLKSSSYSNSKKAAKSGPRRTIARRETEVFIAVGKEIRWADLVYLKDAYEDGQERRRGSRSRGEPSQYEEDHAQGYRVGLKIP